ncbi:vWA domain-containing protein [Psychromonas sp. PT13]|uniref:vWA domain-containing protein n=1 Tax=Psychromonas sp. PT13 TaxID=3439547 RepID=UPI003EBACD7C
MIDTTLMPLQFLRPLWLLGIIVIAIFSLWRYQNVFKSKKQKLIAPHLSQNLVDTPTISSSQRFAFPMLGIIACIALSGPSFRSVQMPVYQLEKAQVLVLDLTYSMYSTDLQPNRLSQEKYKAIDLIKQWNEGDKALIAYAGDAFTISPLTTDGNSIINHIPNLSPDIMPVKGSHPELALDRAITLMKNAGYAKGHIVFFSDGIDERTSEQMIERLKGTPWVVSILAIGTNKGAPIKMLDGSLLKDQQGNIVVPSLTEQPLHALAQATDGLYLRAGNTNADIKQLGRYFDLKNVHKSEKGQSSSNQFPVDDGYWLVLLIVPFMLLLFRKGVFYLLLLSISLPFASPDAHASIWKNAQQNALQAYQQEDYATAADLYNDPIAKGSALYKNKQYKDALTQFNQAVTEQPTNASAFYNQGNTYAQLQQYDKAIESYNQALAINSDFKSAAENKKLIKQLIEQQKQQDKKQQSDQQKSDQQKSDQQKSDQQKSDQQKSDQQKSDQQKSDQQKSDQQKSDQQQSDQQKSDQQKSDQQQSDQQKSDQQQSDQQQSDQQQSDQQQSDQQQSDQQKAEQQKAEQQKAEQQKAEQQKAQQQKADEEKADEEKASQAQQTNATDKTDQTNQELEDLPMWLKNMPDNPSYLLQRKMAAEYQKRSQSQPVMQQKSNGEIW